MGKNSTSDCNDLLDLRDTMAGLKYISKSPPYEHGGFHPGTVRIAKSAFNHLQTLRRDYDKFTGAMKGGRVRKP